jgi:hypothetical protein
MTKPTHVKPSLYAYFFFRLKEIAFTYGYNLVLHGSMNRDLDLIAIPWVDEPLDEFEMIRHFNRELTGFDCELKEAYQFNVLPGGRKSYVIHINRGGSWNNFIDEQYYLDISVTPLIKTKEEPT